MGLGAGFAFSFNDKALLGLGVLRNDVVTALLLGTSTKYCPPLTAQVVAYSSNDFRLGQHAS
jgi:hypothetical protein